MRRAVYPGSFDPLTNGHLEVLQTAAQLFDEVVIAILVNPDKRPLFSVEERMQLIAEAVKGIPNVRVDQFQGLLVDYIRRIQAHVIVRGVREPADYENEVKLAHMNRSMEPSAVTVFLPTHPTLSYVSSSLVKQVAAYGGDVRAHVPECVAVALRKKYMNTP
ncbi:phosphopantetheine adenylyltransferase [Alicyclobacillus contaminans]|uniref:pantetheine-phosphate adenylyltransferase n=1 Tax=Alicyclobacillus contaminans TaxID=392016 RepID=UPI00040C4617|nr:pantetheine-phosphate adenylyltransferase [Alicyclobacillus contaminans]GMA49093.1 phosphopantetheine adenylyltransferase [Alicyclobacillus contaminans]